MYVILKSHSKLKTTPFTKATLKMSFNITKKQIAHLVKVTFGFNNFIASCVPQLG